MGEYGAKFKVGIKCFLAWCRHRVYFWFSVGGKRNYEGGAVEIRFRCLAKPLLLSSFPRIDTSHTKVTARTRWDAMCLGLPQTVLVYAFCPSILSSLETDTPQNVPVWINYMINHVDKSPGLVTFKPIIFCFAASLGCCLFVRYLWASSTESYHYYSKAHDMNVRRASSWFMNSKVFFKISKKELNMSWSNENLDR